MIIHSLQHLKLCDQEVQGAMQQALHLAVWCHVAVRVWKRDWILMLNFPLMTSFPHRMNRSSHHINRPH